ncbi:MAG: hypothetical protein OXE86_11000 [Alphaproteobacteria bacterium]|nr:hypothetical protein [Alphaproteobacteria bacterium]
MKVPDPWVYSLKTEIDGEEWVLQVVRTQPGNPAREPVSFPKHDANKIKRILEALFDEKWTLVKYEGQ